MIGYYKNTGENPPQKGLLKMKNRYETALTQRVGIEDGSSGYRPLQKREGTGASFLY